MCPPPLYSANERQGHPQNQLKYTTYSKNNVNVLLRIPPYFIASETTITLRKPDSYNFVFLTPPLPAAAMMKSALKGPHGHPAVSVISTIRYPLMKYARHRRASCQGPPSAADWGSACAASPPDFLPPPPPTPRRARQRSSARLSVHVHSAVPIRFTISRYRCDEVRAVTCATSCILPPPALQQDWVTTAILPCLKAPQTHAAAVVECAR